MHWCWIESNRIVYFWQRIESNFFCVMWLAHHYVKVLRLWSGWWRWRSWWCMVVYRRLSRTLRRSAVRRRKLAKRRRFLRGSSSHTRRNSTTFAHCSKLSVLLTCLFVPRVTWLAGRHQVSCMASKYTIDKFIRRHLFEDIWGVDPTFGVHWMCGFFVSSDSSSSSSSSSSSTKNKKRGRCPPPEHSSSH